MDLSNPNEVVIYYSLIGEMTCFDHGNEFLTVSVLTYMITY